MGVPDAVHAEAASSGGVVSIAADGIDSTGSQQIGGKCGSGRVNGDGAQSWPRTR